MTPGDDVTDVVRRRQRRAIRTILDAKERLADPHIDTDASQELRKVILDEIGDFADLVVALLPSVARDDVELNGYALELLEKIHSHVTANGSTGG